MDLNIDGGYDILRIVNVNLCFVLVLLLFGGLIRHHKHYNQKTRDYWYSRVMWCATGIAVSIEELRADAGFTVVPIFVIAATIVTFKGVFQKGPWGYHGEEL
jgi:hypothetical protein